MVILNVKNLNNNNKSKIAMTLGDPSGIGPEVVAKSIQHLSNKGDELPFIIGDTNTVNDAFSNLDTDIQVKKIKN